LYLNNVAKQVIAPLFGRITEAIERILIAIHQENFGKYVRQAYQHLTHSLTHSLTLVLVPQYNE
jgi:hypothetical protein